MAKAASGCRRRNASCAPAERFLRAGGGVVHRAAAALQPRLKGLAVFADVVEHPGQAGLLAAAKGAGKLLRQGGGAFQMLEHRLDAAFILGLVGEKAG